MREGTGKGIAHSQFILLILDYVQSEGQRSTFRIVENSSILLVESASWKSQGLRSFLDPTGNQGKEIMSTRFRRKYNVEFQVLVSQFYPPVIKWCKKKTYS